jgi:hypothetical protein
MSCARCLVGWQSFQTLTPCRAICPGHQVYRAFAGPGCRGQSDREATADVNEIAICSNVSLLSVRRPVAMGLPESSQTSSGATFRIELAQSSSIPGAMFEPWWDG